MQLGQARSPLTHHTCRRMERQALEIQSLKEQVEELGTDSMRQRSMSPRRVALGGTSASVNLS